MSENVEQSTASTIPEQSQQTTEPKSETTEKVGNQEERSLLSTEGETTEKTGESKDQESGEEGSFDLKIPDGFEMDESMLKEFTPLAKEMGMDAEKAQKFVDMYVKGLQQQQTAAQESWSKIRSDWRDSVSKNDRVFGGDNWQESKQNAHLALKSYMEWAEKEYGVDSEIVKQDKEVLNSWAGDIPLLVRFASFMGRTHYAEDSVSGSGGSTIKRTEADRLRNLYDKSEMK